MDGLMLLMLALPVLLLAAGVGLAVAYNRLGTVHRDTQRDRDSFLEVLEGSNDALFVIDFANGRILQANAQAATLLGAPPGSLEGRSIFDLHPRELLQTSAERIADAWERKGDIYEDIPLVNADGAVIPVESSVKVTSYNGRPAVVLFARDIRERLALRAQVESQQAVVQEQNRELLAGIRYAQRIQRAVLPEATALQDLVPDSFILFRPRDIVSGDLYWFGEQQGHVVVAAADCTGHGVPGALLSLIGASLFRQLVLERGCTDPAIILNGAREGMIAALTRNDGADHRDGMNVGLISLSPDRRTLSYAGAYGPLYLVRNGDLMEYKGDRMPIGLHEGEQRPFRSHQLDLLPGDRIYLFSDGIPDQFGGPQGKKLRSAGMKRWLMETADLSMEEQHQAISDRLRMWMGEEEQVDDMLLIGMAVGVSA